MAAKTDPKTQTAPVGGLILAAGEIDEPGLTRWIRDNWPTA